MEGYRQCRRRRAALDPNETAVHVFIALARDSWI
jgi:hypothetical protein